MSRFQWIVSLACLLALMVMSAARADTVHTFSGEITYLLYGDGTTVDLSDPNDVAASNDAGIQLQSSLGLSWMTQGLSVTIRAHVPDSLAQQYPSDDKPDWRRYESGTSSINWTISSGSNAITEDGGLLSANNSTVLVWDNIFDNPDGVDRYTVNSFGTFAQGTNNSFAMNIGLWENGSNGALPITYDFGADPPDSISNYLPDVRTIYAGADGIREYMTYTQGLLVEGTDEYWAKTFDTVLSFRQFIELPDGSTQTGPTFMAGIMFNRAVPEPSSIMLLSGSVVALLISGKLRRQRCSSASMKD